MKIFDRIIGSSGVITRIELIKKIIVVRTKPNVANQEKQELPQTSENDTSTSSTFKSPLVSNSLSDYREQ